MGQRCNRSAGSVFMRRCSSCPETRTMETIHAIKGQAVVLDAMQEATGSGNVPDDV